MEVLNLDSPVLFSSPAFIHMDTALPRKRRSRKRSFNEMNDSDESSRSRSLTPTKRRKSAEGCIINDKPRDFIYVTPKPDSIRHDESEELRPEGNTAKPKKRKADVFLFDFDMENFQTRGDFDFPLEFNLDEDVEEDNELVPNNPLKTPFEEDLFELNLDMDNSNDGHEFLRKQSEVLPETRFEKDFASLASSLNFNRGKFESVKTITCQEVRDLLIEGSEDHIILDCRFDYEFFGGHIRGATRCTKREDVEKLFNKYEHVRDIKFILHCELSVCRAPRAGDYLACLFDRYVGRQPSFLIMKGGYARFWKLFQKDEGRQKIFGIHGYMKEDSLLLQCRTARRTANKGWDKVLIKDCEDDDCIQIC